MNIADAARTRAYRMRAMYEEHPEAVLTLQGVADLYDMIALLADKTEKMPENETGKTVEDLTPSTLHRLSNTDTPSQ